MKHVSIKIIFFAVHPKPGRFNGAPSLLLQVKVYRTTLEHFAVVYPQKKVCRPLGFVNLRHTVVDRLPAGDDSRLVHLSGPAGGCKAQVRQAPVWVPRQYQHHAGLVVRHRECDSPHTLAFLSESPKELESWLSAFDPASTSPSGILGRQLPILEESEEM